VHRHRHSETHKAAVKHPTPLPSTPAPRDPVLPPLDAAASHPTAGGVKAALAKPAAALSRGAHLVGEVIDARSGDRLWAQDPHQPEPPASTTKLMTAAAALSTLGPTFRLTTATRRLGRTVYLVGGGDTTIVGAPSSYDAAAYPAPATFADLARQTARALGHVRSVRLRLDATAWTGATAAPGWKPIYVTEGDITPPSALEVDEGRIDPRQPTAPRTLHPIAQAGEVFADLLRRNGIRVAGTVAERRTPAAAKQIGAVTSPPMGELVQRMLAASDDDLAEAIGRAVAIHAHRPGSFAGAAHAVTDAVHDLHISVTGVTLKDTSGLSHDNRIPPRTLVGVLRTATDPEHPELRSILTGLPVAGLTGTLEGRFIDKPSREAAGVLRAKTGTLTGVNALAGVVVDRNGRLLIFAFLASVATPGVTVPALDRLASRLERCGCDRA
jgi:D-alanyl-D-alanine carboxypeptidase/D-alanyl-D-alanine-endopeptidase (penicillin-binding protein 4)